MLKLAVILSAVIVAVVCFGGLPSGGGGKGQSPPKGPAPPKDQLPPAGECKSCDSTIKRAFDLAASVLKGMEPIEMKDMSICKKVLIPVGPSTMCHHGKSCMITEPKPSKVHWQQTGFMLKKLHVECHIVPLNEFTKALGLPPIPMPSVDLGAFGSTTKVEQIIVVEGKDLVFDFVSKINFEDDICNVTKLALAEGKLDTIEVSLKGNDVFTKLGELITGPKPVRCALGLVVQMVLRVLLGQLMGDPKLKEIITILNCGDTDY